VSADLLSDPTARHPTWTHGRLVERRLSSMTRAALLAHGLALLGEEPHLAHQDRGHKHVGSDAGACSHGDSGPPPVV